MYIFIYLFIECKGLQYFLKVTVTRYNNYSSSILWLMNLLQFGT